MVKYRLHRPAEVIEFDTIEEMYAYIAAEAIPGVFTRDGGADWKETWCVLGRRGKRENDRGIFSRV